MSDGAIKRNRSRDSWRWIWGDTLFRCLPFWLVGLAGAHFLGGAAGLAWPRLPVAVWLALSLGIGAAMTALAAFWRGQVAPWYRLPTPADQGLQTAFYLLINAPAEEIFWRGTLQTLAIRGFAALALGPGWSAALGIGVVAVVFGAYHRLGGYPWRFNGAAMLAGGLFGALFVLVPGPSIVVPSIVHGLTTAGYLSWGDVALDRAHRRRLRRAQAGES